MNLIYKGHKLTIRNFVLLYWKYVIWMCGIDTNKLGYAKVFALYRQFGWRAGGIQLLSKAIYSLLKTLDLVLVPHLFIRYFLATFTLHIIYEIGVLVKNTSVRLLQDCSVHGRKQLKLKRQYDAASSYKERLAIGELLDEQEGKDKWRRTPNSSHYDYNRVMKKTSMYKTLQEENDISGLMFYLRAGLLRKHWGLGNPKIYGVSYVGTKMAIEEYMDTIVQAMNTILNHNPVDTSDDQDEFSTDNKLDFFNETRHAFGRSALLLSGGGSLGLYHSGVVKALVEQNMLPTVVSGASAGSIVAGIVGVRTHEELLKTFQPGGLDFRFFGTNIDNQDMTKKTPIAVKKLLKLFNSSTLMHNLHAACYLLQRWSEKHYILDINVLKACVRKNIGNFTFREAYDRTGRIINITVTPSHSSDYPQLLNYLTAPNVLVWSASIASCAIPGIFSPVELLAKDKFGNATPYYPEGLKWSDGSVECDLPMERLSELFNVNHFIVSQVNIHYKAVSGYSSFGTGKVNDLLGFFKKQMKAYLKHVVELGFNTRVFKFLRVGWIPLLTQSYEGDITVCPNENIPFFHMVASILKNPTDKDYTQIVIAGEKATWKYMARIRTMCKIEFALESAVRQLRGEKAIQEAKQGLTSISRVPSFYTSNSNNNLVSMAAAEIRALERSASEKKLKRNRSIAGAVMSMDGSTENMFF